MASADTNFASAQPGTHVAATPILAPLACINCKIRKKGCDKRLPSCGHCVYRSVYCAYPKPLANNELDGPNAPDRTDRHALEGKKLWSTDSHSVGLQYLQPSISSMMLIPSLSSPIPSDSLTKEKLSKSISVDEIIRCQVCRTILTCGRLTGEISEQYFGTVHRWLPIVSREHFYGRLADLHSSTRADFSILLLAMCLITSRQDSEMDSQSGGPKSLYLTTKMLFAHAQVHIVNSISLIQVGLLVANFEYACGMMDVAYISIGTCARMAFAVGLHNFTHPHEFSSKWNTIQQAERQNVWWGIVTCERLITGENVSASKPLATQAPNLDEQLPVDLDLIHYNSRIEPNTIRNLRQVTSFGREAQAACLYSRVSQIIQLNEHAIAQSELSDIDQDLRDILKDVIYESGATWGLYCGAIAFAVEALFALHEYILNSSSHSKALQVVSEAALRTAARMIVDVARSFNLYVAKLNIDALPPRTSHLVKAAHHVLVKFNEIPYERRLADVGEIRKMLECLGRRWRCARIQLDVLDKDIQDCSSVVAGAFYVNVET